MNNLPHHPKGLFIIGIALIMMSFLMTACSSGNLKDDYVSLQKSVDHMEKEIIKLKEITTSLEETKKDISDHYFLLNSKVLSNGHLLFTNSIIPMSIIINDLPKNNFRVIRTTFGIILEYNDGENQHPVANFVLVDIRSVGNDDLTFPYNDTFLIAAILPIGYQTNDEAAIQAIENYQCQLRVNDVALYSCNN